MNFNTKTLSLYSGMQKRFGPKYYRGKLVDPGRELPFTLPEFRHWVNEQEVCTGVARCRCCGIYITLFTAGLDHSDPVSRGGSIGLENLNLEYCKDCNRKKGSLYIGEFEDLVDILNIRFEPAAKKYVMDCLGSGGIGHFAAMARMKNKYAGKKKVR